MLRFLRSLFKRVYVIEIKGSVPTLDKATTETIKTLQHHAGFLELTNRLRIQRAFLETKLKRDPNANMISLQHAIYWSEYWERMVEEMVNKKPVPHTTAVDYDVMGEFNRINGAIERIG